NGKYTCVYPIKVNQQRQVVEKIIEHGQPFGFGLEAGSKPELLAVIALANNETPIICNGFKDAELIEMAMLAAKAGRRIIPIVEKFTELPLILRIAEQVGVRPEIGMRVKLATRGAGRWQASGGLRSKFGLTVSEVLQGLEQLKQREMADCFKLLHFHLGSQITNIRFVNIALLEAARIYVDLVQRGAGLETLDVGGGLGVDYDGSQSNFHSSMNYTVQEYANDVVYHIQTICDDALVRHPNIISESGRAVAAYHSVLVFDVLGVASQADQQPLIPLSADSPPSVLDLRDTLDEITVRNLLESYHDAQQAMETAMNLFSTGHLPLDQRATVETLFWKICRKIQQLVDEMDFVPEELEGLDRLLADTYFCNFSLFQSIPDSWELKQLFPVMPIHRLNERPSRHAVLGDVTCDSDGKLDQFIDRRDLRRTLQVHDFDGTRYSLGVFLVGAYQEILGDLHNLFGDTNAVHVTLSPDGATELETVVNGDTVAKVLSYVQFKETDLINRIRSAVETAVGNGKLEEQEARQLEKFFEDCLRGYTYLE
ncbi:MAG: biosynthetic arginine decarboxylase, partial [Planctomycetes bacterium]|nr:biosynthetic arginine decarboxylase [Planctomycetota bacterium]